MKKIVTLSVVGLASLLAFTVACDDGGVAVDCTSDTDCEGEAENTVCDTDVGVCVAPAVEECAEDLDCDLQDVSADSPIAAAPDGGCAADEVQFTGFDGNDYCGVEDEANFCTDSGFETADVGDGTIICILGGGTCTDGSCG